MTSQIALVAGALIAVTASDKSDIAAALAHSPVRSSAAARCSLSQSWEAAQILGLGTIHRLDYNPTHLRLAVGSDRGVEIWNVESGQLERILTGHTDIVDTVSWSPDGSKIASGSHDATIKIWDAESGDLIRTIAQGYGGLWSPDGSKLLGIDSLNPTAIKIWRADGSLLQRIITDHFRYLSGLVWSPDGSMVASSGGHVGLDAFDNVLYVWNAQSGTLVNFIVVNHTQRISSLSWSPDGSSLATSSYDLTIRFWEVMTGNLLRILTGHDRWVYSLSFSADSSRMVSSAGDRTMRIWDVSTGQLLRTVSTDPNALYAEGSMRWSLDGSTITSHNGTEIHFWDSTSGELIGTWLGHTLSMRSAAWSPDGSRIAAGSIDQTIKIWDASTGMLSSTLSGHTSGVESLAWSSNGLIASGSLLFENVVKIWDGETGALIRTFPRQIGEVLGLAWSPDNSRIATLDLLQVNIWDVETGNLIRTIDGTPSSLAWSPDASVLAIGRRNDTIQFWNPELGELIGTIATADRAMALAWSPEGSRLAAGYAGPGLDVWDVRSRTRILALPGHRFGQILSLSWSSDGSVIASASNDATAKIWDADNGNLIATLTGHLGVVKSAMWRPNGCDLLTASPDATVRIWSPAGTGEPAR